MWESDGILEMGQHGDDKGGRESWPSVPGLEARWGLGKQSMAGSLGAHSCTVIMIEGPPHHHREEPDAGIYCSLL